MGGSGRSVGSSNEKVVRVKFEGLEDVDKLRSKIEQLEAAGAKYNQTISEQAARISELAQANQQLKDDSGVSFLEDRLKSFQSTAQVATKEFESFLKSVNLLDQTKGVLDKDSGFSDYARQILDGAKTAGQAITEVKTKFAEMLSSGSGGTFDSQVVESFRATLESVLSIVQSISSEIEKIQTNGVKSTGGGVVDMQAILNDVDNAAKNLTNDAKESYDAIVKILGAINGFANIDSGKMFALSETLKSISSLGGSSFGGGKVDNIIRLATELKKLGQEGSGISKLDFKVKVTKQAVDNLGGLATHLKAISRINSEKLEKLQTVDFSNFSKLTIDKSSLDSISEFVKAINGIRTEMSVPSKNGGKGSGITAEFTQAKKAIEDYYKLYQKMYTVSDTYGYHKNVVAEEGKDFTAQSKNVEQYVARLNEAKKAMDAALAGDKLTDEQKKALKEIIDLREKEIALRKEQAEYKDANKADKERNDTLEKANALLQEMQERQANIALGSEGSAANEKIISELQTMIDQCAKGEIEVSALSAKIKEIRGSADGTAESFSSFSSGASTLSNVLSKMGNVFTMMVSPMRIMMAAVRSVKQMVSTAIEIDTAMAQMQIVTKQSDATMQAFGETAARVAKETATSITDIVNSATTFARLGYSLDESAMLSKYTGMLQRVGDIDVSSATDAITAIIKAYDVDASEIESVMDKLVEVGNNFPISVEQIATGMNNASSSLAAAGNSFEQSVALLTAANTTVQDAAKASTGLRTIAARIRNTKAELDELGEEMIATPKYEELVQNLTKYNVSLLDSVTGEYRSTFDIMKDLAAEWDNINENVKAAITTQLAGTRQQAIFNSIINQFKEASGAMDAMAGSAGALEDAYSTYLDSTQAHIDQFKASMQDLAKNLFDGSEMSFFVDIGTGLVEIINSLQQLHALLPLIVGTIVTLKSLDIASTMARLAPLADSLVSSVMSAQAPTAAMIAATQALSQAERDRLATMITTTLIEKGVSPERIQETLATIGLTTANEGLAISFKAVAASIPVWGWIALGVSALIPIVSALSDSFKDSAERLKELKEEYGQLSSDINNISGDFRTLHNNVDEIAPELSELAKGVDQFGNNVSLTDEEYDRFLELNNQIAEMFPELNMGMDESGNYMLALSYNADTLTDSLKQLVNAQREVAQQQIADMMPDVVENVTATRKELAKQLGGLNDDAQQLRDVFNQIISGEITDRTISTKTTGGGIQLAKAEELNKILKDLGVGINRINMADSVTFEYDVSDKAAIGAKYRDAYLAIQREIEQVNAEMEGSWQKLNPIISAWMSTDYTYNTLSSDMQRLAVRMAESLDFSGINTAEGVQQYITDNVINEISNMAPEVQEKFSDLLSLEAADQSTGEYIDQINEVASAIANLSKYDLNEILSFSGFDSTMDRYLDMANGIVSGLSGHAGIKDASGLVGLYTDEIKKCLDIVNEAKALGVSPDDIIYGNIDTNNRGVIEWSSWMLRAYEDEIKSIGMSAEELEGTISTVLGSVDNYDGIDIAFSPMLQTEHGVRLLDQNTIDQYIYGLLDKVKNRHGSDWTKEQLLLLDDTGLEINGRKIQGLIADIGDTAEETAQKMHFTGTDGALTGAYEGLSELTEKYHLTADDIELYFNTMSLSPDEMTKAFDYIRKYGISTWDDLKSALDNKTFEATIDFDVEKEAFDKINDALDESASASGMAAESIDALKQRYAQLDSFDPERLFEHTANGVRVNTKALNELENELQSTNKAMMDNKLEDLADRYVKLTEAINEETDAAKRIELYSQRDAILQEINDAEELASRYAGLTSAYNEWLTAKKQTNEREGYEAVAKGYDEIKELIDTGFFDDSDVEKYLDLMLSVGKRTGDNVEDFNRLTKAIDGTKYSIRDFFQFKADGKTLTSDGIFKFFEAVHDVLGDDFVTMGEGGFATAFDFSGEKLNQVAEALGMSVELVQLIERAAQEAGFEVTFDSMHSGIEETIGSAKDAIQTLQELKDTGEIAADVDFDYSVSSIEDLETQIEKAKALLQEFTDEDGVVDLSLNGATEAATVLATLILRKSDLEAPAVMKIVVDEEMAETEIGKAIKLMQDFKEATALLEAQTQLGVDTTEAQAEVDALLEKMSQNQTITGELNINTENADTAIATINSTTTDMLVTAGLDSEEVDEYDPEDLDRTVTFYKDSSRVDSYIALLRSMNLDKTVTITTNTRRGTSEADGTAHARGTALLHGYWGTRNSGIALGGEDGQELVVRDGHFFTIGDQSAEMFRYRKGDIIFNADQTEQILKYGKIISGQKRGFSYVSGTAFDVGSGGRPRSSYTVSSYKPANSRVGSGTGTSRSGSGSSKSGSDKDAETWFEREYKLHNHMLKMESDSRVEYFNWLNEAYQRAYKENVITLDEFRQYEEEVFDGLRDLFTDYLSDIEHEIKMRSEFEGETKKIISLYREMMNAIQDEIAEARAAGLKDTDDYIQDLQTKYIEYQHSLREIREDAQKDAESAIDTLIDYRLRMLKQETSDEKDALNERLSDLKEFYDEQKKLLRDQQDEDKYLDDQAEKRQKIYDLQSKLSELEYDNSAAAQKQRLKLMDELAKAQKELDDFERDHAIQVAEEELDKLYELQEKEINSQIDQIDKHEQNARELYDQALADIRNGSIDLYQEMIEWNNIYGDGIENTITTAWEEAYAALEAYNEALEASPVQLQIPNKIRFDPGEQLSIEELLRLGLIALANVTGHSTSSASWSTSPLSDIGANMLRGRLELYGFASGTSNAPRGIFGIDELGTETIFQSKDGNKYKLFTGGEKVLTAKASDFLYKFATSGGEFLSKMINSLAGGVGSVMNMGRPIAVGNVSMGDIIVQGNADMGTVSEIRRAQRESLDNILREFNKLNR